jgi:hypothetical protein
MLQSHGVEHWVVMPSQVTCPFSLSKQLRFTAVQLEMLVLLEQEMLPVGHVTVAVQSAFPVRVAGRLATWRTPLGCVAQELAAGRPRIAARASLESGGWLCVWPKPATATKRREQVRIDTFFISSSFGLSSSSVQSILLLIRRFSR